MALSLSPLAGLGLRRKPTRLASLLLLDAGQYSSASVIMVELMALW